MSKQKLLFVAPHLSTGGLPQYLYVKIRSLIDFYDVYVCMWSDIAPIYDVQRKAISDILPQNSFISWPQGTDDSTKSKQFMNKLNAIQPNIVHIEEFPETFLPNQLCEYIYSSNRAYTIIETSHDSAYNPSNKRFLPDSFVFVSDIQRRRFQHLQIPTYIVEYPIDIKDRPNRDGALRAIGLDPSYKHILNVGLFTPGKNQEYAFEIAKSLPDVMFHFIGNQAENFRDYWEPLMNNKPHNCIIHGERRDVDKWYSACDLLLFTSKKELNPLVPREAISWQMPVLMFDLPIYEKGFDKYNNVEYLEGNIHNDIQNVRRMLGMSSLSNRILPKIRMIHLLTRPEDQREIESVKSLSPLGNMGIEYKQHINEPETHYPEDLEPYTNHIVKRPGYYGAYKAFRRAIEKEFSEDIDFLMICECDCILTSSHKSFMKSLYSICNTVKDNNIHYFSLGPTNDGNITWSENLQSINDSIFLTNKIILAHCILFPQSIREWLLEEIQTAKWDSPDIWLNSIFMNRKRMGIVSSPLAVQHEGRSLIDNEIKEGSGRVQTFSLDKSMDKLLIDIYNDTKILDNEDFFNYNFLNGAFLEVVGKSNKIYTLELRENNRVVYSDTLKTNHYIRSYKKYFTKWNLRAKNGKKLLLDYNYDASDRNVYISFGSKSLGDTLAWIPYVEEFRKLHNANVYCSTFWNNLFIRSYPLIHFIRPGQKVDNLYASYVIEFTIPYDSSKNPVPPNKVPLQKVACDILGLKHKEIQPKIDHTKQKTKNIICFAMHSTAQCKYWNNPNGWQEVVNYINSIGMKAVHISKENNGYMGNHPPKGIIDHTGEKYNIQHRIKEISSSRMFIGVGSGLSWLAWALDIPVILISGFSKPWCEFSATKRIHNPNVCNGCFNEFEFDRGNWNWCPKDKDFECTKSIDSQKVIKSIQQILSET